VGTRVSLSNAPTGAYVFSYYTVDNAEYDGDDFTLTGNVIVSGVFRAAGPGPSGEKAITAFTINGVAGTINEAAHTIGVTLPHGTDLSSLAPAITVSQGAEISPASGAARDFTNSQTYTVTAGDGSTVEYIVTVTVDSPPPDTIITIPAMGGGSSALLTVPAGGGAATLDIGTNDRAYADPGAIAAFTLPNDAQTALADAGVYSSPRDPRVQQNRSSCP
jgi:hypothetical protein